MTPDDMYWDELGIAWRAMNNDLPRVTNDLKAHVRRQSMTIAATLAVGIPLVVAGVTLGIFTMWAGWRSGAWNFVTRGTAIELMSVMLLRALASFLPFKAPAETHALSQMLDTLIARAHGTLVVLRTGMAACLLVAVFGMVGVVIRTRASSGPQMSPVVDLAVLALIALCLWLYAAGVKNTRAKFEYLRRTLGTTRDEDAR